MNMYFIALVLPEELDQRILQYKKYMHEIYGCTVGLKSPAHITIIPPFWMQEEHETELKMDLDALSSETESFQLQTNNFSSFRPRTIFIELVPNEKLQVLKGKSGFFFNGNKSYRIRTDSRPFHPHITIATRDLYKKDFHEAWPYFEEKKFVKEWKANGLSLLKHNTKNWDVIYTSPFKNL